MSLSFRAISKSLRLVGARPSSSLAGEATTSSSAAALIEPGVTAATSIIPPAQPTASTSTSSSSPSNNSSRPRPPPRAIKPVVKPSHNIPTLPLAKHVPITPSSDATHVATLHLRSHTTSLEQLTFFTNFALRAARALNLPTSGVISLPTKISLYTTPRSPFAHKKSQENFWRKEHKRAIKVYDGHEDIVQAWLAYLRKEAMGGVGMKAQVITYRRVGWGEKMIKDSEGELRQSAVLKESATEVEKLADEIVRELMIETKAAEVQAVAAPVLDKPILEEIVEEVAAIVKPVLAKVVEVSKPVEASLEAQKIETQVEEKIISELAEEPKTVEAKIESSPATGSEAPAVKVEEVPAVEKLVETPSEAVEPEKKSEKTVVKKTAKKLKKEEEVGSW